jgi:hypothetical protein
MSMKAISSILLISIIPGLTSCTKDSSEKNSKTGLALYLDQNKGFTISDQLIACAASQPATEPDYAQYPISVFFYPITGAYEYKYFECNDVAVDIKDYAKFNEKTLTSEPVMNGYLRRFKNSTLNQDVWGIVTYKVGNVIHICRAIRIKHYTKPTQFGPELVTITDSLTFPRFDWKDGTIAENAIYFQIVSDTMNNLISGTYTYDKYFKFYNLSNVVLNIRDVNPPPALLAATKYNFMLMTVSTDNWVNLIGAKSFNTQ